MAETILKDIGIYKDKIISSFVSSDDICKLMLGEDYTQEDIDNIIYKQIFPYLYIDESQINVLPYLCIEADIAKPSTRTIKEIKITIWAYCHINCIKYSKNGYSGTRADILADMVENVLRSSNEVGIGKLNLESASYFSSYSKLSPYSKYYGRQLIFTASDFKTKKR